MQLIYLLKSLDKGYIAYGKTQVKITSISDDSRKTIKGGLFVAIKGLKSDGHKFIPQVINMGGKVVVGEIKPKVAWLKNITYIRVKNSRVALGQIASSWFKNPSTKLKIIGVTGTKGKTTTVHMINHILNSVGESSGLLSSVAYPGLHVTTPGPIEIHKFLRRMFLQGKKYVVIEVSSHGIDQDRIAGVEFEVGVLTNITPEHLDYHKTFAVYKKTKLNFIKSVKKRIICPKKTKIDIFPGRFNNLNAEAAVLAVKELGVNKDKAISALHSFKLPKGRLESILNTKGINIIVDFAHTSDSLKEVLTYIKSVTKGRVIAVFGCAGERDTKKRPAMGRISTRLADVSVFTAEDPRSEKVEMIISQMVKGVEKRSAVEVGKDYFNKLLNRSEKDKHFFLRIPERGEAISFAIQKLAQKGDTVILCGKGHEKSMAYNGVEYPWSDQEAVRIALKGGVKKITKP